MRYVAFLSACCLAAVVWLGSGIAMGQGLLVVESSTVIARLPRPHFHPPFPIPHPPHPFPQPSVLPPQSPGSYKIQELDVQVRMVDQTAQVQVSQTFVNTGSIVMEASLVFPLPYDGAIDRMTLLVDGKEMPARLLSADEARRTYENIVRKNKDPALLEWVGSGMFKTSVFPIPPGRKRVVSFRYSQLCRNLDGLTDFLFPLSTAKYTSQPIETIRFRVSVESASPIKNIYSPSHAVEIRRPDETHATATWTATQEVPGSDFRLMYDVGRGKVTARLVSYRPQRDGDRDGYFLLLASPEIKVENADRVPKTVVFALDRSGSMGGRKIEQARAALKFVLENLRPGDLFNIVAYDSAVETFRPELQRYDETTRKAALAFADGIYAGGSTNIAGALKTTLGQLQDTSRPNYVLFLTDGLPTDGETNEAKIAAVAKEVNRVKARVFAFGVGNDVNARLLDTLARDHRGVSDYVRPNEDIEDRVSRLYRRIDAPVMTDVEFLVSIDAAGDAANSTINRVYPRGTRDLSAGEQLVLVGRYRTSGDAKITIRGRVQGQSRSMDFPAKLVEKSTDETNGFIEKLWAVRRVGEILDELDLKGKNDELVKELVDLAVRHGIVTPYTSFLADETTNLRDHSVNASRAMERLDAMSITTGEGGVSQRVVKNNLQYADNAATALSLSRGREADSQWQAGRMIAKSEAASGRFAGMAQNNAMGGGGPGMQGPMASPGRPMMPAMRAGAAGSLGGSPAAEESSADREMRQTQQAVRTIGNRTFYQRANRWVDASVTSEQEKQPIRIRQFSKEYFELARNRDIAACLTFDEPVLINAEGRSYLIEP